MLNKSLLRKVFAGYISAFLIFQPVAFADEKIATVNVGDPAPFSGTLFNTEAAARILTDLEFATESCNLETERRLGLQSAEMQLKIDTLQASLDACNQKYDTILSIKQDQILFLDQQLQKANKPNSQLWFVLGVVGGVIITGTAAWSINQVSGAN
tara:strand:+ start:335 stop:799 length:465 start_codon:yes stop_codon:yes gene_type:complete